MIFITGPHAAGKTHLSKYLSSYGFPSIDLGPTIRKLHSELGLGLPFLRWVEIGEGQFGPHFTDELLAKQLLEFCRESEILTGVRDVLIVGSRSLAGIYYLRDYFKRNRNLASSIVYIEADKEILRERYNLREGKALTKVEFEKILKRDEDMGLLHIRPVADHLIFNDGNDKKFRSNIDEVFFSSMGFEKEQSGLGEGIFRRFRGSRKE